MFVHLFGSLAVKPFLLLDRNKKRLDAQRPLNILFVSLAFRGDLILCFPAIAALKRRFPDSKISCWVKEFNRTLAQLDRNIDEVVVYDDFRPHALRMLGELLHFSRHRAFLSAIRYRQFALFIDDSGLAFSSLIGAFAGIPLRIGRNTQGFGFMYHYEFPSEFRGHLIEKRFKLLEPLGIAASSDDMIPKMSIPRELLDEALTTLGLDSASPRYFTVQPFGGWEAKNWGLDKLAYVVDKFAIATGMTPVVVGGSSESESIQHMNSILSVKAVNSAGKLDLPHTAALISGSKLHLGVDSVGSHIAEATGVKSLTIFGPTNPRVSAFLTQQNVAVFKRTSCTPKEGKQYCCRDAGRLCPYISCMEELAADDVFTALNDLWEGKNASSVFEF